MVHAPVLNLIESVATLQWHDTTAPAPAASYSAAVLCSPPQPMPEANWSTVCERWTRWSVANGECRAGFGVDPGMALNAFFDTDAWKNISITKDCLQLNNNLVSKVESRCSAMRSALENVGQSSEGVCTVFQTNCAAHSCVLALKPMAALFPGLSSCIVRVGHLHQSHRAAQKYPRPYRTKSRRASISESALLLHQVFTTGKLAIDKC